MGANEKADAAYHGADPIAPDALQEAVWAALGRHWPGPMDARTVDATKDVLAQVAQHRDAEVERLREWKAEALTAMSAYQDLAQRVVPAGAGLGRRWSDLLAEHVDTLTLERDNVQDRIARALAVLDVGVESGFRHLRLIEARAILTGTDT